LGFAVKEVLLVVAIAGSGAVCLTLLNPISDEQRQVRTSEPELLMQCEVAIGDEFVCVATVTGLGDSDSSVPSLFKSHLQFARKNPEAEGAFLFGVTTCEIPSWKSECRCRTWSFTDGESLMNKAMANSSTYADRLMSIERARLLVQVLTTRHGSLETSRLPDPLWECVPRPLQEYGLLAITGSTGIEHVHELSGFPLSQLAAAIHRAATEEDWERENPQVLLPATGWGNLSHDTEQALARALIWRLAGVLPAGGEPGEVTLRQPGTD
jgi:hypothetical protein